MSWTKKFKRYPYFLNHLYQKMTTSIAFYPTFIAIFFISLTALMLFLEEKGLTDWVSQKVPGFFILENWDVAQSVLTTLVGALISLMVFSFSMVMVLLNNAASNYSPRILPSLIADKFHQFVLGIYLGTITYCLLLAINLTPDAPKAEIPGIAILLAVFLGLNCLMIFVFFIHSISEAVQVGKILESLSNITQRNLKSGLIHDLVDRPIPDTDSWSICRSDRNGYLKEINCEKISELAERHQFKIKVLVQNSTFVLSKTALFCCNIALEKDTKNELLEMFIFSESETAENDHAIGFRQINEIAIKAMSPGVNDPGTALIAINLLTLLFDKKMELKDAAAYPKRNEEDEVVSVRLWLTVISFKELLSYILTALRAYASHDLIVVLRMLTMLEFLATQETGRHRYAQTIWREAEKIRMDAKKIMSNPEDYDRVVAKIRSIENKLALDEVGSDL